MQRKVSLVVSVPGKCSLRLDNIVPLDSLEHLSYLLRHVEEDERKKSAQSNEVGLPSEGNFILQLVTRVAPSSKSGEKTERDVEDKRKIISQFTLSHHSTVFELLRLFSGWTPKMLKAGSVRHGSISSYKSSNASSSLPPPTPIEESVPKVKLLSNLRDWIRSGRNEGRAMLCGWRHVPGV